MKFYLSHGERDPITVYARDLSTSYSLPAQRPLRPRSVGFRFANKRGPLVPRLTVASLKIWCHDQIVEPIPLAILAHAPELLLADIGIAVVASIQLISEEDTDVSGLVWLECDAIHQREVGSRSNTSMTSAEIMIEFIKGRPHLEALLRKKMTDPFCAPEAFGSKARVIITDALAEVSGRERDSLDRMRGNGSVDWTAVARAFGAREDCE